MNLSKKFKFGAYALLFSTVLVSCSDDDSVTTSPNQGNMKIAVKATFNPDGEARMAETTTVSSFIVNFKEIELEMEDMDDIDDNDDDFNNGLEVGDGFYGSDDDIELEGPWEIDLVSENPVELATLELPNGIYEEIEFEFDKSKNPESDLYGKSMKMTGEIGGAPFVFWHDFDEEVEIDFEDSAQNFIINNDENMLVINFDLTGIIGSNELVDLTTAVDGNGDGVITISPEDEDGNQQLAEQMKEAIKSQIELLEEDED